MLLPPLLRRRLPSRAVPTRAPARQTKQPVAWKLLTSLRETKTDAKLSESAGLYREKTLDVIFNALKTCLGGNISLR